MKCERQFLEGLVTSGGMLCPLAVINGFQPGSYAPREAPQSEEVLGGL